MGVYHLYDAHVLEVNMKKLVLAAAFAGAATAGFAGSVDDAVVEAPVVVEEATSSSSGALLPIILLVILAAAASN